MSKSKLYIYTTLVSLVVADSLLWISFSGLVHMGISTWISLILIYLSIYYLIKIGINSEWGKVTPRTIQNLIKWWIGIGVFNFTRGLFLAENYWDYKFIFFSGITFSLVSLVFFIGINIQKSLFVFKFVLYFLFPLGFLLIPLSSITNQELYSRIMIPISLFILFIPFVKFKYRTLIVVVALTSILMVIGFRTNLIKIAFSVFLLFLLYCKVNDQLLRVFNLSLFVIPLIFLFLAATGNYNIFEEISSKEALEFQTNEGSGETLGGDTRTFLYVEVINSINQNGKFLIGSGMSGGYESIRLDVSEGTNSNKRYACEVGILNILMKSGLVGIVIYFLILFKVSFVAISQSSNMLSKILGLYISSRWLLSFMEEFTQYDLNFYFFWFAIGLVSSSKFRSLTEPQIKNLFRLNI